MATNKQEITIPIFDGQNYNMWKKRISVFLRLKRCEEVIKREKEATDKEDWDEKNLKAINYIYSAISDKQLEFVCDEESAYKIIDKFDKMYLKQSTALQILYRNKIENMKLTQFADSATFFSEFEKAINDLKSAGAIVTERDKLVYILNTLPESYSHIGDLVDTLQEGDRTAEYVKNKIKMAEMKMNKELEKNRTKCSAFVSESRKQNNGNYLKHGNVQWQSENGGNNSPGMQGNRDQFSRGRGNGYRRRGNYVDGNFARGSSGRGDYRRGNFERGNSGRANYGRGFWRGRSGGGVHRGAGYGNNNRV